MIDSVGVPGGPIRFGVFELDMRARELRKQGRRVPLQDKPFEVLALLLEKPGELVTREDLRQRLWPGDTFVVFDDNLNTAVKKVRDALGDTPDGSRFIETVPRRGYKFIAPVSVNGPGPDERPSSLASRATAVVPAEDERSRQEAVQPSRASLRRWLLPGLLAAAGFAVGAAVMAVSHPAASVSPLRIRELTLSGSDSEPAASPDGKTIAFTSSRGDGISRIWLKQLTGGEARLTDGPDRRPRFFADGTSLLFIRSQGGVDSAWRTPLVGGAPRMVVAGVVEADPSPADDRIAFVRLQHGPSGPAAILGLSRDGGQDQTLHIVPNAELASVRWSPDGRTIAAVRRSAAGTETALVFVDIVSGKVREITGGSDPGAFGAVAWNGNGSTVIATRSENAQVTVPGGLDRVMQYDVGTARGETLFFAPNLFGPFRTVGNNGRIDVVGPERLVFHTVETRENLREISLGGTGGSSRISTSGNAQDRQPAYSPDGSTIVFTSNRSGNYDLWTLSTATGELHQFTDDPAQDRDPAFSADGRYVLWSSNASGHLEIWRENMDHSDKRQISHDGVDAENPTTDRSSSWIVYTSRSNPEKAGIWRMKPDGSNAKRLVAGDLSLPEISPDGRFALYRENDRARQRSTIRVVQVEDGRVVPFEIAVPYRLQQATENLTWGRARWIADGTAIVFVGQDEAGRAAIFRQEFAPGRDTAATRLAVVASLAGSATESFSLSPDGRWIAVADAYYSQSLMLAAGLRQVRRSGG